jgi:hypothetical protein
VAAGCLVALTAPLVQAQSPGVLIRHDNGMGQLFDGKPAALDQPLARFIFPGSHDAGAYDLTSDLACNGRDVEIIQNIASYCPVLPAVLGDILRRLDPAQRVGVHGAERQRRAQRVAGGRAAPGADAARAGGEVGLRQLAGARSDLSKLAQAAALAEHADAAMAAHASGPPSHA